MSKKDLKESIEEHRQSIDIEEEQPSRMSRSSRKVKKKQHKFPLMTTLTFILIGIPLMILIYVWGFYNPEQEEVVAENEGSELQLQTNTTASTSINEKKLVNEGSKTEEATTTNDKQIKKNDDEKDTERLAKEKEDEERKKAEEQKLAKEQAEAERRAKEKAEEEKKKKEEEQKAETRKHTVVQGDTLYKIAKEYYKDPSAIEKIKRANNLRSDTISVGQTLILP